MFGSSRGRVRAAPAVAVADGRTTLKLGAIASLARSVSVVRGRTPGRVARVRRDTYCGAASVPDARVPTRDGGGDTDSLTKANS